MLQNNRKIAERVGCSNEEFVRLGCLLHWECYMNNSEFGHFQKPDRFKLIYLFTEKYLKN